MRCQEKKNTDKKYQVFCNIFMKGTTIMISAKIIDYKPQDILIDIDEEKSDFAMELSQLISCVILKYVDHDQRAFQKYKAEVISWLDITL